MHNAWRREEDLHIHLNISLAPMNVKGKCKQEPWGQNCSLKIVNEKWEELPFPVNLTHTLAGVDTEMVVRYHVSKFYQLSTLALNVGHFCECSLSPTLDVYLDVWHLVWKLKSHRLVIFLIFNFPTSLLVSKQIAVLHGITKSSHLF